MRKLKPKICALCNTLYHPTGSCSKVCPSCRKEWNRIQYHVWVRKTGRVSGKGSGSNTGTGPKNHMYKHGCSTFDRWARERKQALGCCESCGKDITKATRWEWVGHHKDHDKMNNTQDNLQILCKKCHQIEHECWKAFEGVTTIRDPITGRFKRIEAPTTSNSDDMVCSIQECIAGENRA